MALISMSINASARMKNRRHYDIQLQGKERISSFWASKPSMSIPEALFCGLFKKPIIFLNFNSAIF
jgi:hypothetical protein